MDEERWAVEKMPQPDKGRGEYLGEGVVPRGSSGLDDRRPDDDASDPSVDNGPEGLDAEDGTMDYSSAGSIPAYDEALAEKRVTANDVSEAWFNSLKRFNDDPMSLEANRLYYDRLLAHWQRENDVVSFALCETAQFGYTLTTAEGAPQLNIFHSPGRAGFTELDRLVVDCTNLADQATAYLHPEEAQVAYGMLGNVLGGAVGLVDGREELAAGKFRSLLVDGLALLREQLGRAAEYVNQGAQRAAQLVYLRGMVMGAAAMYLVGGVGVVVLLLIQGEQPEYQTLIGCALAGCTGAVVSVMARMTRGTLVLDYKMKSLLKPVAMFRPVVGAVFGVTVFAFITAGLVGVINVPSDSTAAFFFFLSLGFLAGFSERFAQDMLSTTEAELNKVMQVGP